VVGTSSQRLGYRPALDGLRAVAIALVILVHTESGLFPGGYIGVDLFFVLSGFLITTLLLEEHGRDGSVNLGRFYLRRTLRLYPALLGVVGVVAVWEGLGLPAAARPMLWGTRSLR